MPSAIVYVRRSFPWCRINRDIMAATRATRSGEFGLIERYFRPLATTPGALGLGDDAAYYRPSPGEDLVLSVDTIAAGVHFLRDDPPASIGRKALRVNLSDLAAKGARPVGYLLSLALPDDWSEEWIAAFARGLEDDQQAFDVSLLGGDTTRAAGDLTISVTVIGCVPSGEMVLRSGARAGDVIFVSGTIGDAALGLEIRRGKLTAPDSVASFLDDRYMHPQPRLSLAPALRRFARSAMDVSDGLVGDLAHICEASGVSAEIEAVRVPMSSEAKSVVGEDMAALATALSGGDDYEILATVDEPNAANFVAEATSAGVPVARIGRVVEGKGPPIVLGEDGEPLLLAELGHTHF